MKKEKIRELICINIFTGGDVHAIDARYQSLINRIRADISDIDGCMHFAGFDVEGIPDIDEYKAKITNIKFVYVGDKLMNAVALDRGVWMNLDGAKFVYRMYIKDCPALKPVHFLIDEGDVDHVWITECSDAVHSGIKVYATLPTIVCKALDEAVAAGTMLLIEMNR